MIIISQSRPKKFKVGAFIIMLFERTKYSHYSVQWYDDQAARWFVFQATLLGGVNFISLDRFNEDHKIIGEYFVKESLPEMIETRQYCIDSSGDFYGALELLGIAFSRIYRAISGLRVLNPWPQGQVCCEVVLRILKTAFKVEIDDKFIDDMGLKDTDNILRNLIKNRNDKWGFIKK
jgi:hypothetical protein